MSSNRIRNIQPDTEHTYGGSGLLLATDVEPGVLNRIGACRFDRLLAVTVPPYEPDLCDTMRLLKAGATDVIAWSGADSVHDVSIRFERWRDVDDLIASPLVRDNLVGQSRTWLSMLRELVEVARFTDASVYLTGESGTGKELAARLIHSLDARPNKGDLVVLDCSTVVPELSGSEFFGHERGAFTGASAARDGAFAMANGGTLFLDEVGELQPLMQAQLLRAVQERTYKRVGGNTWHQADFRLVCATNRDLWQEVLNGRFRADLYHRLAGWTCRLPSLRERRDDILPLTRHFIRNLRPGAPVPDLTSPVRDHLLHRDYPGNVRDLKQTVTRIAYRHIGSGPVTAGAIPEDERQTMQQIQADWRDASFEQSIRRALAAGAELKEISSAAAETAIRLAVDDESGNLQKAARRLGVTDRALQIRRANRRETHGIAHGSNQAAG